MRLLRRVLLDARLLCWFLRFRTGTTFSGLVKGVLATPVFRQLKGPADELLNLCKHPSLVAHASYTLLITVAIDRARRCSDRLYFGAPSAV